jgi:multicomponent Na+:H+ antiporter subunit E
MKPAVIILVLSLVWAAVTGVFSLPNLLLGAVVALAATYLLRSHLGDRVVSRRSWAVLRLMWLFVYELVLSGVRVAVLVLSPNMHAKLKPGFVAFPLAVKSDGEIALLANLITLTPGTLSVDVSADRKTLLIHVLVIREADALVAEIANGFERRVMEVFR